MHSCGKYLKALESIGALAFRRYSRHRRTSSIRMHSRRQYKPSPDQPERQRGVHYRIVHRLHARRFTPLHRWRFCTDFLYITSRQRVDIPQCSGYGIRYDLVFHTPRKNRLDVTHHTVYVLSAQRLAFLTFASIPVGKKLHSDILKRQRTEFMDGCTCVQLERDFCSGNISVVRLRRWVLLEPCREKLRHRHRLPNRQRGLLVQFCDYLAVTFFRLVPVQP
jgi:hypothetical protein